MLLFNGYWMMSNRQIYENKWYFIDKSTESMQSHHIAGFEINWATPA
jgi:hypothetical protein